MALCNSQPPNDPNFEVSIDDDFLKFIADAVHRTYRIYGRHPNPDDVKDCNGPVKLDTL